MHGIAKTVLVTFEIHFVCEQGTVIGIQENSVNHKVYVSWIAFTFYDLVQMTDKFTEIINISYYECFVICLILFCSMSSLYAMYNE